MATRVYKGASLRCSMGSTLTKLTVLPVDGLYLANVMDFKPMINVRPFGKCKSLANPTVAAATAANYGRLQPMPCLPNTVSPWMNGKMDVLIKGSPALMSNCKLMCMWAGVIEISDPGQQKENSKEIKNKSELMFCLLDNGHIEISVVNYDEKGMLITKETYKKFDGTTLGIINNRKHKLLEKAEELEYLISKKDIKESEIQRFFEDNPEFILDGEYDEAIPQVILEENGERSKPDFILKPKISVPAKILELKLPKDNIISDYSRGAAFTQKVIKAVGQLKKYQRYFESKENRKTFLTKYQFEVYRPKLALIVGKDFSYIDSETVINLKETLSEINITTYQDLLEKYRQNVKRYY